VIREPCYVCALKHISQATVLLCESLKGYPHHFWLATGHIAEAEDELLITAPDLVETLRTARLALIEQYFSESELVFNYKDIVEAIMLRKDAELWQKKLGQSQ
jgi:hypothetical protein